MAVASQLKTASQGNMKRKAKKCCHSFRRCLGRLPFWTFSSFLMCLVGITMFSGGLYATIEAIIKQLELPVIAVAIWGLFILHVLIAGFFLFIAALSTGETRQEASNMCKYCNLFGRWCLIGNIITAYILHFIWYILPLAMFFPTGAAVGGGIVCHLSPRCVNLSEKGVPQMVIDYIKPNEYVSLVRSFNASQYDQYIDQAEQFVHTAIDSLENSPMLDQIISFVENNIPSENEMDAMIGQIVKTVDPERIAAMLDTMQERVDEGLDKFEEVGQTISDKISEIDINQLDSFMDLVFNNTRELNLTELIEMYDLDESVFEQFENLTDAAFDNMDEYITFNTSASDVASRRRRRYLLKSFIVKRRMKKNAENTVELKNTEEEQKERLTDELLRQLENLKYASKEDEQDLEKVFKQLDLTNDETKQLIAMMRTDAEKKKADAQAILEKALSRGSGVKVNVEKGLNELKLQTLEQIKNLRKDIEDIDFDKTSKEVEDRAQELVRRAEALGMDSTDGLTQNHRNFLEQNGARFSEYIRITTEVKQEVIRRLSEMKGITSEENEKLKQNLRQTLEELALRPEDIEQLFSLGKETSEEAKQRTNEILSRHLRRIADQKELLQNVSKNLEKEIMQQLEWLQQKLNTQEINADELKTLANEYISRIQSLSGGTLEDLSSEAKKFLESKGVVFPNFEQLTSALENELMKRLFELKDLSSSEANKLQVMLEKLGMRKDEAIALVSLGKESGQQAKQRAKEMLSHQLKAAWEKQEELEQIAQELEKRVMEEVEKLRQQWLEQFEGLSEEELEQKLSDLSRRMFSLSGGNIEDMNDKVKEFLEHYGIKLPPDVQLIVGLRDELMKKMSELPNLALDEAQNLRRMIQNELNLSDEQVSDLIKQATNAPQQAKLLLNKYLSNGLKEKENLELMARELQQQLLDQVEQLRRQVLENIDNLSMDMLEQKAKELAARVNDLTGGHLQNLNENTRQFLEEYGGKFSDYAVLGAAVKDELLRRIHSLKDALPDEIKDVEQMLMGVGLRRDDVEILIALSQGKGDKAKERVRSFLEENMRRGMEEKEKLEKVAKELEKKVLEEVESLRLMALNAQAKGQEFAAAAQVRAIELARRVQDLTGGSAEGISEEAKRFMEQYGGRFSDYQQLAESVKEEVMRRIAELQNTSSAQAKELQEMLIKEIGLKKEEALMLLELGKNKASRAQADARELLDKGLKRGYEVKDKLESVAKELEQQVLKEVEELQRQAREKFGELSGKAGELGTELEERANDLVRRVQALSGGNPENMTEEVRHFLEQRGARFLGDAREVYRQFGAKVEEAKRQARELAREMSAAAKQMAKEARTAAFKAALEARLLMENAERLSKIAAKELDDVKKQAAEQAAKKAKEAANAARSVANGAFSKARDVLKNADQLLKTAATGALGQLREVAKNLRRYIGEFIDHARFYVGEGATFARQSTRMLESNKDFIADTYVEVAGITQRYLAIKKVGNDTYCSDNKDAFCYEVKKAGVGMVLVFVSCFIIKLSMIHFLMCMSANYVHLKREAEMERFRLIELLDKEQYSENEKVNFMMSDTGSLVEEENKEML